MPTVKTFDNRRDWLVGRYDGIGASETAGIFGRSRFSSAWSIWRPKVDRPEPTLDEPGEMIEWGHRHEAAIAAKLEEELRKPNMPGDEVPWDDWKMIDPGEYTTYWADDPSWLFCTPDRLLVGPGGALLADAELKCAWYDAAKEWKQSVVPEAYRIQAQIQMHCTGVDRCYYAALLNGHQFVWFVELRNDKFIASAIRRLTVFWEQHVKTGIAPPPDFSAATASAITAHYDEPNGEQIELPDEADAQHQRRLTLKAEVESRKRHLDQADNWFKATLGNATVGRLPSGAGEYTWKPDKRGRRSLRFKAKGNEE